MKWRASTVKPSGRIWSHQKDVGRSQVMCFCSASWRFPNGGVAALYHLSGVVSSPSFEWVILNSCFLSFKPFQTYILDGNIFVIWIMPLCAGQHLEKTFQELLQDLPVLGFCMSGLQLHWEASPWFLFCTSMLHFEGSPGELSHMFGHRHCLSKRNYHLKVLRTANKKE